MNNESENQKAALKLLNEYYDNIDVLDEKRVDEIFRRLEQLSPDPAISDYVFYPEGKDLTPEEVVEKAFSYNSIKL